tara:strand:+ start:2033 stop:2548 length:516 start_codon:yes stop_codon:yes gene_type:complete
MNFELKHGSKNGFQTRIWGPPAWFFLHTISLNYSPVRKHGHFKFFKSLGKVLPCGACRDNYNRIISKGPLKLTTDVLKSRKSLSLWLFKVHNKVQNDIYEKTEKTKDKPLFSNKSKDFMKAMESYETYRAECHKKTKSYGCVKPMTGPKKCCKLTIVPLCKFRKTKNLCQK